MTFVSCGDTELHKFCYFAGFDEVMSAVIAFEGDLNSIVREVRRSLTEIHRKQTGQQIRLNL